MFNRTWPRPNRRAPRCAATVPHRRLAADVLALSGAAHYAAAASHQWPNSRARRLPRRPSAPRRPEAVPPHRSPKAAPPCSVHRLEPSVGPMPRRACPCVVKPSRRATEDELGRATRRSDTAPWPPPIANQPGLVPRGSPHARRTPASGLAGSPPSLSPLAGPTPSARCLCTRLRYQPALPCLQLRRCEMADPARVPAAAGLHSQAAARPPRHVASSRRCLALLPPATAAVLTGHTHGHDPGCPGR